MSARLGAVLFLVAFAVPVAEFVLTVFWVPSVAFYAIAATGLAAGTVLAFRRTRASWICAAILFLWTFSLHSWPHGARKDLMRRAARVEPGMAREDVHRLMDGLLTEHPCARHRGFLPWEGPGPQRDVFHHGWHELNDATGSDQLVVAYENGVVKSKQLYID